VLVETEILLLHLLSASDHQALDQAEGQAIDLGEVRPPGRGDDGDLLQDRGDEEAGDREGEGERVGGEVVPGGGPEEVGGQGEGEERDAGPGKAGDGGEDFGDELADRRDDDEDLATDPGVEAGHTGLQSPDHGLGFLVLDSLNAGSVPSSLSF